MLLIFLSIPFLSAQDLTVSGRVTDKTGESIIGASILVQGTTSGTITDFDGNFTLQNVTSNAVLVVSYVGYKTQNVSVNGKTLLNIVLEEDTETLEEVVVVGYGVQRKSDLTGAVASVKASDALKKILQEMYQMHYKAVWQVYQYSQVLVIHRRITQSVYVVSTLLQLKLVRW